MKRKKQAKRRKPANRVVRAELADAEGIQELIARYARKNVMLMRPLSEIYETIREFKVYKKGGRVIGCGALHIYWNDIAEIRALAVNPRYTKRGVGTKIVRELIKDAKALKIPRVFALTLSPEFFKSMDFVEVDKTALPMKIWADCIKCPKFMKCDEYAVVYDLV